jgi:hypothetical protein
MNGLQVEIIAIFALLVVAVISLWWIAQEDK